jgi:hypothetical protein
MAMPRGLPKLWWIRGNRCKGLPDVARRRLKRGRAKGDPPGSLRRSIAERHRLGKLRRDSPWRIPFARWTCARITWAGPADAASGSSDSLPLRVASQAPTGADEIDDPSRVSLPVGPVVVRSRASDGDLPGESCSARHSNKRRRAERAKAGPRASPKHVEAHAPRRTE